MAKKTCFVIMAIGDQEFNGEKISYSELKSKYDDLIKEALLKARPDLDIVRADGVPALGMISTDIVSRIMRSDYVLADVTYPNPNVFYELGLSHASRPRTIIVKDNKASNMPFDISHHRYIGYDNTASGLKNLAASLSKAFDQIDTDPEHPDSQFLYTAKINNYEFPDYKKSSDIPPEVRAIQAFLGSPDLIELFARHSRGEKFDDSEFMKVLAANPNIATPILLALAQKGVFD
ncbi:hypothetical protein [Pseudomonas syringae]|uniref:hypothetical protein n=1 Tax=Pseudomonas syringae TaxID=317 RepID=UPI000A743E25|nr:hypothetical protein [Pseudomonas syringae]